MTYPAIKVALAERIGNFKQRDSDVLGQSQGHHMPVLAKSP